MTVIAVIPAKGTSKRIPRKNIRHFMDQPILAYSIKTAKDSGLFDQIVVSTEDDEVASVAVQYGAKRIKRPPQLAEVNAKDCGTQEVSRHALLALGVKEGLACCIYPCAPTMTTNDLLLGYSAIKKLNKSYVYVKGWFYWGQIEAFLVRPELHNAMRLSGPYKRWVDINTEADWQKAETIYRGMHETGISV